MALTPQHDISFVLQTWPLTQSLCFVQLNRDTYVPLGIVSSLVGRVELNIFVANVLNNNDNCDSKWKPEMFLVDFQGIWATYSTFILLPLYSCLLLVLCLSLQEEQDFLKIHLLQILVYKALWLLVSKQHSNINI